MWQPALTGSDLRAFESALTSSRRVTRYRAQLYRYDGEPLPDKLIVHDGSVDIEATDYQSPTRTAEVTLLDPDRRLKIDYQETASSDIWHSRQIGLFSDVWVPDFDEWIPVPVFRGPIFMPTIRGIEVRVSAYGKEAQHLDPYLLEKAISYSKHMRVDAAIRRLLQDRDESRFRFDVVHERLHRALVRNPGQEPWKTLHNKAKDIDRQLFFDGEGVAVLRRRPSSPVFRFREGENSVLTDYPTTEFSIEGVFDTVIIRGERHERIDKWLGDLELDQKAEATDTSIHVKAAPRVDEITDGQKIRIGSGSSPEERTVDGSYTSGSRTIPLTRALSENHKVGAAVEIKAEVDRVIRVAGRDSLPDHHAMSSKSLTGGKRSRMKIIDRPGIHRRERALEVAQSELRRIRNGIEISVPLEVVPIPTLEELDPIAADIGDRTIVTSVKSASLPLNLSDRMSINTRTKRKAKRRSHKRRH